MADPKDPAGTSKIARVSKAAANPSITIEGWDIGDGDLVKLLEDTAEYLKKAQTLKSSNDLNDAEMVFKRVETGDLFTIAHRS